MDEVLNLNQCFIVFCWIAIWLKSIRIYPHFCFMFGFENKAENCKLSFGLFFEEQKDSARENINFVEYSYSDTIF